LYIFVTPHKTLVCKNKEHEINNNIQRKKRWLGQYASHFITPRLAEHFSRTFIICVYHIICCKVVAENYFHNTV